MSELIKLEYDVKGNRKVYCYAYMKENNKWVRKVGMAGVDKDSATIGALQMLASWIEDSKELASPYFDDSDMWQISSDDGKSIHLGFANGRIAYGTVDSKQ